MRFPWPTGSAGEGGDVALPLDGSSLAARKKQQLRDRGEVLKSKGVTPGLGTILVGEDPASHISVGAKHRDCEEVGIRA